MIRRRILRTFLLVAGAAGLLGNASLAYPSLVPGYPDDYRHAYDPREVAALPAYCKYTQLYRQNLPGGNDPAAIKRMYDTYGPGFHALHHYCWAIIGTNRALYLARTQQVRAFYLKDAVQDIDFVIANSPPDFVLLPELLTAKGKNLIRLGNGTVAVGELMRAMEIKPDYWPPYAVLSDFYKETGEVAKARQILERGLSFAPESNALRKRLAALKQPAAARGGSGASATQR